MMVSEFKPVYLNIVPDKKENGIVYISKEFELAIHLCACGCGAENVMPLCFSSDCHEPNDVPWWQLIENPNGTVTFKPSIEPRTCKSHYYITNNKVVIA